ncbi:uncharacterized protein cubi_01713 [Cryptosporidium ubiquitum]|uniref:Uncharacterized protein n=1 Tax=Cryptosporidium ubiquitum TaxID=857276 RepID=A0A1J4MAI7_9CRYT|nr:uncharacterized protein cubi_01713 [Cryptosporidium ubiquitum]OII71238.1 hypothetical protein cubi_01713 [Cryptosporidium ubiquitum]
MNLRKDKNQSLFDKESYEIPNVLFKKEEIDNSRYIEKYDLIELLINSLNFKIVIITLINGSIIKGTVEYRKVLLNKIQYKSIKNKRLKMILLKDIIVLEKSDKCPNFNANYKNLNTLFIPIKSIFSLTCPEIDNPSKHIKMYIKSSILNINHK